MACGKKTSITTVVVALLLLQGSAAKASTSTWVGGGDNNWLTASQWNPAMVPSSYDDVYINNGGTAVLQDNHGAAPSSITLGDAAGQQGTLNITGSSVHFMPDAATIGNYGTGTILVEAGGDFTLWYGHSYETAYIARYSGSSGTLTVTGKDSQGNQSTAEAGFYIGSAGDGTLRVLNGGSVGAHNSSTFGLTSTGRGTLVVDGRSSSLYTDSDLIIGDSGTGSVTISNYGSMTVNTNGVSFYLAKSSGGSGSVLLTDSGSTWYNNKARTYIGYGGTGTVTVQNGADSYNSDVTLGYHPGSSGNLTVTGTGSTWNSSGTCYVGDGGDGTLAIRAGATMTTGDSYLAYNAGSGSATVTGSGSLWQTAVLRVGYGGTGNLTISNGARVTSTEFRTGIASTGTATVDGSGSRWECSGYGILSQSGRSTLNIQNGGYVSTANAWLGWEGGSLGTVNVKGAGSQWINSGDIAAGHSNGGGSINVTTGGYVSAQNVSIGESSGGPRCNGTVTVDGNGSQFVASGNLTLGPGVSGPFTGNTCNGTLTVQNSGLVTVGGSVTIGGNSTVVLNSGSLSTDSVSVHYGGLLKVQGSSECLSNSAGVELLDGGVLQLVAVTQSIGGLTGAGEVSGTGTLRVGTADVSSTFAGTITGGALNKIGSGTLTLTGNNTYTGGTTVSGGTLLVTGADERLYNGGQVSVSSGATFQVDGVAETIAGLAGSGQVSIINGGTLRLSPASAATYSFSGSLTGNGTLIKNGTGTCQLLGDNSAFGGNISLSAGTLKTGLIAVGANSTATFSNTGGTHNMVNSLYVGTYTGGTGRYELSGTGTLSATSVLLGNAGVGTFAMAGGTATLSSNMYLGYWSDGNGVLSVSGGTMTVGGSLIAGGRNVAGGSGLVEVSGGSLTVTGTLKVWPGGTIQVDLGGALMTNDPAPIIVGTGDLAGTLVVTLINGLEPQLGDMFNLFQWTTTPSTTFDHLNLPALSPGLGWDSSDLYSTGQVSVVPEPSTLTLLGLLFVRVLRRRARIAELR